MVTELVLKGMANVVAIFGIGGISQSVTGHVVSRCADPNLTEEEFLQLAEEVAKEGYVLEYVK